jgi:hypothetical protein
MMDRNPCQADRAWASQKAGVLARAQTVYLSTVFSPFGFTLNEKQIPQIIEKNKNLGAR